MSNPIFPRYSSDEKPREYTSLSQIQQHQSYILKKDDGSGAMEDESGLAIRPYEGGEQPPSQSRARRLFAPTVQLSGHAGEVYCVKFSPDGNILASSGFDKQILLWDVFNDCLNTAVMKGHTNAILELHFSTDGSRLYTCSADKTVAVWDLESCKRLKKFVGHTSFVNSCHPARRGPDLVVSGSDDCSTKVWDFRAKNYVHNFDSKYQVTAVSFNDTSEKVLSAGLDNQVRVWDMRKKDVEYTLFGHTDTVTGLALSFDGSYVLSNAMDQTVRCWDIRPFVVGNRCVKIFQGNTHNFEKNLLRVAWGSDGSTITAGSADRNTYIWDTTSRKVLCKLGGHNGSVNETCFSPKDRLLASASSDRTVIIGEIPDLSVLA